MILGGKVKELLIRSKLPGSDLMKIWYASPLNAMDYS